MFKPSVKSQMLSVGVGRYPPVVKGFVKVLPSSLRLGVRECGGHGCVVDGISIAKNHVPPNPVVATRGEMSDIQLLSKSSRLRLVVPSECEVGCGVVIKMQIFQVG